MRDFGGDVSAQSRSLAPPRRRFLHNLSELPSHALSSHKGNPCPYKRRLAVSDRVLYEGSLMP